MAKVPTGALIELDVGELADQDVRAVPTELHGVVGTSTGLQLGESEMETREFGTGEGETLWDDGAVISKNWQFPFQANFRPEEDANALIEETAFSPDEIYVALYPLGKTVGSPYYWGYATVNGYSATFPRDGALTVSATLRGRGPLTKGTYTE